MNQYVIIVGTDGNRQTHKVADGLKLKLTKGDRITVADSSGNPLNPDLDVSGNDLVLNFGGQDKGAEQVTLMDFNTFPEGEVELAMAGTPNQVQESMSANELFEWGDKYDINPALGNAPMGDDFSLMRFSSVGFVEFIDDLNGFRDEVRAALRPGQPIEDRYAPSGGAPFTDEAPEVGDTIIRRSSPTRIFRTPPASDTPPNAVDDFTTIEEDSGPVTIAVLNNDTDREGPVRVTQVNPSNGTARILPNGEIEYTAPDNFSGTTTLTYSIVDIDGNTDIATVTIDVTPVNDAPEAKPDIDSINEDDAAPATGNVLDNDVDIDGSDVLAVTAIGGSAVTPSTPAVVTGTYGTITQNSDGTYSYALDNSNATVQALAVGQSVEETFTYTADDGNGGSDDATLTITINGTNDAPVANPGGGGVGVYDDTDSITEDAFPNTTDGNVLTNDSDPDGDTLKVGAVNSSPGNVGTSINGTYGAIVINEDGTYNYTLNNNNSAVNALNTGDSLTENFTYLADDGNGGSAQATLAITINGTDDATVIVADAATTDENTAVVIDVLANDSDVDDTLTVASVDTTGLPGDSSVTNNTTNVTFNPGTAFDYLAVGESDVVTFTYTTNTGATETVTVTVTGTNDGPVAVNDTGAVNEDATLVVSAADGVIQGVGTDTDLDTSDVLSVIAVRTGTEAAGTGTSGPVGGALVGTYGTLILAQDGSYSYAADQNAADVLAVGETADDIFTYSISDGNGGTDIAQLTITVTGTNDAPTANPPGGTPGVDPGIYDDTDSINEDDAAPATGNVLDNDVDLDGSDVLAVTAIGGSAVTPSTPAVVTGTYGTITQNSDGTYSYALDNSNATVQALAVGESVTETFTYTADDGNGGSDDATLTITINGTNDAPVANPGGGGVGVYDDTDSISEDAFPNTTNGNVLTNDSDPDGDTLKVSQVNGSAGNVGTSVSGTYGSVTLNEDGSYRYTLNNNNTAVNALDETQSLTENFTYLADDGNGGSAQATLAITINGTDDATVIVADAATTDENTAVVIDVLANDSDVDDTLTVASVDDSTLPGDSSVTNNTTNVTFNPGTAFDYLAVGESDVVTFTYTTNTGATETVTVTVTGTNDGPVAVNDTGAVNEDATLVVNAADGVIQGVGTDTDLDTSDVLSVIAVRTGTEAAGTGTSGPVGGALVGTYGTLILAQDGSYSYAADQNAADILAVGETANDIFTYTISDGNGGTDIAQLTIEVTGTNDAPTANPPGGTPGVDPGIYDDTDSINEDDAAPATGNVLDNDVDLDGSDVLAVTAIGGSAVTPSTPAVVTGTYGTITQNSDGTYSYALDNSNATVQALGVGQSVEETFTYTADDGNGGSDDATLTITINGTNDAPVANPGGGGVGVYDDTDSITEDAFPNTTDGNVLTNDSDPDGDTLKVGAVNSSPGNVGTSINGTYGAIVINEDGTYNYTLNNNNSAVNALNTGDSLTENFTYLADDGNGGSAQATLAITINGTDDATVIVADAATTDENTAVVIDVLANDSDVDDTLTVASVNDSTLPGDSSVTNNTTDVTFNPGTAFDYLAVGESDVVTFTYTTNTGATETVTVTVTGTNDGPVANPDTETTPEDTPVNLDPLDNDTDPDTNDNLSISGIEVGGVMVTPTPGVPIVLDSGAQVTLLGDGTLQFEQNGVYNYLDNGQSATDSFVYKIDDGNGGTATSTFDVTITGLDDPTVTTPDSETTPEDTQISGNVLANDSDPDTNDNPLTIASNTNPSNGNVIVQPNGDYTYTPGPDFNGTDTFTYTTNTGSTETVTITVTPGNDNPVAVDDAESTDQDSTVNVDLLSAIDSPSGNPDSDIDGDSLTVSQINGIAAGGTFAIPSGALVTVNANGTIDYDPNGQFDYLDSNESATDTLNYTIDDGNGGTDTAQVNITITGLDDPSVTTPDAETTPEDTQVSGNVLANDSDPDTNDNPLTIASNTNPSNGNVIVQPNGDYTYTPGPDFNGTDTFTYTTNTGSTETVTITVTPGNDNPVAVDDAESTDQDSTVNVDLLSAIDSPSGNPDSDIDGDSLTVSQINGIAAGGTFAIPSGALVTVNANGTIDYDPNGQFDYLDSNESATDTLNYTIDDGNGGTDTAQVNITITGLDDPTVTTPDAETTPEDTQVSGNVLANDSDPDTNDNPLTIASNTNPSNGNVIVQPNGDYTYTPGPDFNGTDTFTYTTNTGSTETVTITVTPGNDNPVAVDDAESTDQDSTVNVDLLSAIDSPSGNPDSDIDGDSLRVTEIDGIAAGGTFAVNSGALVTVNANGTIDYDPNGQFDYLDINESATDTLTYTIDDGNGGTDTAQITITINGIEDATVTNPDSETTPEDTPVSGNVLLNDSDPDTNDNPLTVASNTAPTNGSVIVQPNGDYTYTPGPDFNGTDTFTYTTNTGATETVTVTVTGTNDGPVAVNDTGAVNEDATLVVNAADGVIQGVGTDTDVDTSDVLNVTAVRTGTEAAGTGTSGPVGGALVGTYGTLTLAQDGSYSYVADQDVADILAVGETADDIFTYSISDGNGGTDTAQLTITVTGTNDAPLPNPPGGTPGVDPGIYDDTDSINEDDAAPATGNVLDNDVDLDGSDVLAVTAIGGSAVTPSTPAVVTGTYGTITQNSDGTYSYALDNSNATVQALAVGESVTETFTYTADDGNGGTGDATLTITINGTNDAPVANPGGGGVGVYDDTDSISEDAFPNTTNGNVLTNDSDPDGDTLKVGAVNSSPGNVGTSINGTYGAIVINEDGTYNYTLNNNNSAVNALNTGDSLTENFTYLADDGNGGSAQATLAITINGTDDATVIVADAATTDENTAVVIDVLANDSDVDDTLTVASVDTTGLPGDSSVTNNTTNVTFNPGTAFDYLAVGESDVVTFTYTTNTGATETVTVTVTGTNDGPVAVNDTGAVNEDATLVVSAADGVIQGVGTDTDLDTSDVLSVIAVRTGTEAAGTGTSGPVGGALVGTYGTLILAQDGSYSYAADQNAADVLAVGETADDIFTYSISDGNGGTDIAQLTITVTGTNDAPTANPPGGTPGVDPGIYDDTDSINEDDAAPATGNVLDNDVDLDGSDVLAVTAIGGSAVTPSTPAVVTGTYGTITQNSDGTYSYALDNSNATVQALAVGESVTETFTYTADDGNGGSDDATLTITINGTNDAPVANPGGGGVGVYDDTDSISEDAFPNTTNGNVLTNDSDPDGDTLKVGAVNSSPGNVGTSINGTYGAIVINEDGTYNYTLNNNNSAVNALNTGDSLTENFTYLADDGNGGSAQATLAITINGTDDATVIVADAATTDENTAVVIDVLANDSDVDDTLTVASVDTTGLPGDSSVTNNTTNVTFNPGTAFDYLAEGESDVVTFTYTTNTGATETVTVTVTGTNDGPVANPDTETTPEDTPINLDPLDNDTDPDTNDTLKISGIEVGGVMVTPTPGVPIVLDSGAQVTLLGDGTLQFEQNGVYSDLDNGESAVESFVYQIDDGNGGTATSTFDVTITGLDNPTVTNPDAETTPEDTPVSGNVLANDSDPDTNDNPLTVASNTAPTNGAVTLQPNGDYTYTPDPDFNGTDTFTYTTNTGATETVTINVTPVNDPPVAESNLNLNNTNITPVSLNLVGNDADPDGTLDLTSVDLDPDQAGQQTTLNVAGEGVWTVDNTAVLTFTPDIALAGQPTPVSYTIRDNDGLISNEAKAVVDYYVGDIWFGNDTSGSVDAVEFPEGRQLISDIAAEFTFGPSTGDIGLNAGFYEWGETAQQLIHIPLTDDPNFVNQVPDDTTYPRPYNGGTDLGEAIVFGTNQVLSSGRPNATKTLVILTDARSDQILGDTSLLADAQAAKDAGIKLTIIAIDEAQDDPVALARLAEAASKDDNGDPLLVSAPTYADITAQTVIDTVASIVAARLSEMPPIVTDDDFTVDEDTPTDINVLANDCDLNGQPLTVDSVTQPPNGTVVINPDGTINYTPDSGFAGTESFTYTAIASNGGSETATVTITINSGGPEITVNQIDMNAAGDPVILDDTNIDAVDPVYSDSQLTYTVTAITNGSFQRNNGIVTSFTQEEINNGEVSFVPTDSDPAQVTYTLEISNPDGQTDTSSGALTPVVIDLDGDGVEFKTIENGIAFDVDADGSQEQTAWAGNDDGVLVYDHNQNGDVDGRSEVAFADYSDDPNATDLEGLAFFDSDGDGTLDAGDEEFAKFKIWQDADGDGQVGEGELRTLTDHGIESIGLSSDGDSYYDANHDVFVHGESEVNYADGSTGIAADAEFQYQEFITPAEDETPIEIISTEGQVLEMEQTTPAPAVQEFETDGGAASPTTSIDEQTAIEASMVS